MSAKKILKEQDPKELVKSFVLPAKLSRKEQKDARDQLKQARQQLRAQANLQDVLVLGMMQLKFQFEDYIKSDQYDPGKKFGYFLKAYLGVINRKAGELAQDISVHKTLISQYMSNSREPNESFVVRLELHSNNSIPAHYWLLVVQKDKVHQLQTNTALRKQEKQNIVHKMAVRI